MQVRWPQALNIIVFYERAAARTAPFQAFVFQESHIVLYSFAGGSTGIGV